MDYDIRETKDEESAISIAKSLPDYFSETGLKDIGQACRNEKLFGAYKDNKMIGFMTLKELNPEAIELTWMGVLAEYQGQGTGKMLVERALKSIGDQYKICEVKTLAETVENKGYEKTRNFWRNAGFITLEVIDPYPGWETGNPCVIMVKPLKVK